ncbi:4Fe-4S binding protein [Pseudoflavonifractor sp. 524-17]|uniref:4Fe-4S binding protein n=1 Tax=Pseudoflavonifractor sp. 524-17 TaxID=2304577 RepID=UPI00192A303A|nr:4Fe-4S binding protein [Pseudoflavonifractor sp. 524-17]
MANQNTRRGPRLLVQLAWAALTNGYAQGFAQGKIWRGASKGYCVPGLNCYSCPGALGACPLGALQAALASGNYKFALYVTGFLLFFGAVLGRFVCGWLCPFGLVQDLLHRIPFPRKRKTLPGDRLLRWVKYLLLAGFVVLLPMFALDAFGQGSPWFCKWVCPSGTLLAGWPLAAANGALRAVLGALFAWKSAILIVLILLSAAVYRPFCRYLCPLGAVYGLFNPIAFCRLKLDEEKCIGCGQCRAACKLDLSPCRQPNSMECIRCGDCLRACPTGALTSTFPLTPRPRKERKP